MRVFNFSAGPAVLPEAVLEKAAAEMLDWHGSGMSVMEMSHRGKEFIGIAAKAEADLRALLAIPADYKVLFLQGGAIAENAIVPMNLLGGKSAADYVNTGEWSKKSIKEAKKYCTVNIAATSEDANFTYVPAQESWKLSRDAAYVHICTNETIGGVEYQMDAGYRRPSAGGGYVVSHPVACHRRVEIRGDLRWCAEKCRAGRPDARHRSWRSARSRAADHTFRFHWKEQADADSMVTRLRLMRSTSRAGVRVAARAGRVPAIERSNIAKAGASL